MDKEKTIDIFEMLGFVLRHPWVLISSIVIITSLTFAHVDYMKLAYEARGLLSFEIASEEEAYSGRAVSDKEGKATVMMRRILVRENLGKIIAKAWPHVTEENNPEQFNYLQKKLRERSGIENYYDRSANLLVISYRDADPQVCYKVVEATISALERENKINVRKKIEFGLGFLNEQAIYYKNKISSIEEEIDDIKSKLKERAKDLGDKERLLITKITDKVDVGIIEQKTLLRFARYDEQMLDLNMQALEAERKKKSFENILSTGEFPESIKPIEDFRKDTYVQEYSKMIAEKHLDITNLRSQGYLAAHPVITKLRKEIEALQSLIESRREEIEKESTVKLSEMARKEAEVEIKRQIKEIEFHIETLGDKTRILEEQYREYSEETIMVETAETREILEQATKIDELTEQAKLSQGYYDNIKKGIEEVGLKSRMEEAEAGVNIVVVESPRVPTEPLPFQKQQRLILGFIFSVFVGISISYVVESLDNSIKSSSELRELLKAPILGMVDQISTLKDVEQRAFRRKIIISFLVAFIILSRILGKFFF